jgi:diguanylate cyclase (GGDEF)-like protein
MGNAITLCVDDDPAVLSALRTLLKTQLGSGHVVEVAESGPEALEICEELQQSNDELCVIISDFIMPGMYGDELLSKVHAIFPQAMTILLTGQGEIDGIRRAINDANLYRFLEKPFSNDDIVLTARTAHRAYQQERELAQQMENLRQMNANLEALVAQRTRELQEKNEELERIVVIDRLTGLYNRLKLDQVLKDELARSVRYETHFSILMLDIDKFKAVNDTFGHQAGDSVLVEFARILQGNVRESDAVGRWGGEEFLIVCRDTVRENAVTLAQNLRQKVEQHEFAIAGHKTVSIGVASWRAGDSITQLMERADHALYRAKEHGRNRVESSH